jgi:hypothetical protein
MTFRRLLPAAIVLFAFSHAAAAQSSRGTVSGIVTDPQAAVVPNAAVELVNADTNVKRATTTNEAGLYRFDAVDLGSYHLTVKAQGFQTFVKRGIPVLAGITASNDVTLALGDTRTLVEITAESESVLQQEAPVRGGNWSASNIVELPIAARNPANLALALPGVSTNRFGFGVGGVEGTFAANGSRGRSNNFLINGTENNDISIAGQGMQIRNPDSVAEVAVQTSNFDAEFGRAGGAVVNVVTARSTTSSTPPTTTPSPTPSPSPPKSSSEAALSPAPNSGTAAPSAAASSETAPSSSVPIRNSAALPSPPPTSLFPPPPAAPRFSASFPKAATPAPTSTTTSPPASSPRLSSSMFPSPTAAPTSSSAPPSRLSAPLSSTANG